MSVSPVTVGLSASAQHTVCPDDTAKALGSGDLDVLGSPRLLAWMEAAACAALVDVLDAAQTSVGTRMSLEHLRASAVGATVDVDAQVVYADGRLVRLEVVARQGDEVCGRAEITRVVVDRTRFLARLGD